MVTGPDRLKCGLNLRCTQIRSAVSLMSVKITRWKICRNLLCALPQWTPILYRTQALKQGIPLGTACTTVLSAMKSFDKWLHWAVEFRSVSPSFFPWMHTHFTDTARINCLWNASPPAYHHQYQYEFSRTLTISSIGLSWVSEFLEKSWVTSLWEKMGLSTALFCRLEAGSDQFVNPASSPAFTPPGLPQLRQFRYAGPGPPYTTK